MKKKVTILAIVSIITTVILSTVFIVSNITSIQNWLQKANLTEVQSDENSGISTFATSANGYKIYGEEPFSEEYSIGAFVPQDQVTEYKCGSGFEHIGTGVSGSMLNRTHYIASNTSKQSDIYQDIIGGFKMGTELYDVRIYFWLVEGDDYTVWQRTDSITGSGFGGFGHYDAGLINFPDGYTTKDDNTVIATEFHFYEAGTLNSWFPREVSVKGIGSLYDFDKLEGCKFISGVDNNQDVYLTSDTTVISASELGSHGLTNIYQTSVDGAWLGTFDGNQNDSQNLHYQFESSRNDPLQFYFYGVYGMGTSITSQANDITYHIEGYVPDGVSYPEDTIYVANYGTYTVIDSLYVSGYKFTGWNRGSISGTNVSGDTLAPITEDIDLYGKFTMDISVKKVWNDNNDQYGERPTSVTVTLYEGNVSTGKTLVLSRYNNWRGTFSNVDASDNYTLRENTLSDYTYAVSGNAEDGFTITNTYSGPIISASKTVSPQPSVGYVLEGETLTYTITVENDGLTSKNVIIKDTIPSGTTFVTGSIKVNNITRWYTQTNLSNGITVNVPANGSSTLSFEVTVDDLEQYEYTKRITNTGIVDGTSTNQVQTIVNKPNVTFNKTASPSSGSIVEKEDIITYTITLDNSRGTAPATVIVKDNIPTGTSFVYGSIRVGGSSTSYTSTNLSNGISVTLNAGQSKTVEFKVTVNDLNNRDTIENVATVDGTQTNQITHTYIEPIISSKKSVETEYNQSYAVEGETITYTITVENDGDASEDVVIKDTIPDGTSFVVGSIKTNNSTTWYTQSNLSNGITVNVPARDTATLSFEVTVDELGTYEYSKTLRNTATVDGEETNEVQTIVNKPNVEISKASSPSSGSTVEKGDTITYTITLDNSEGTAPTTVIVKDNIPTGTTFVNGSIRVGGYSTGDTSSNLAQGIGVALNAGQTKTVEFKVTVNDLNNGATIENVATVDDEQTNKTIHTYIEPVISGTKSSTTENNLSYVVEGETITYTITVENDGDASKDVVIKDTIPDGTSFVIGSIKTNSSTTWYTQSNLSNGIEINVPARESATLSFDVIVNDITDGSLTKEIRNTAQVDGTTTNEVIETVHKPNVEISKSASPESGTKVTTDDTITYYIELNNSTGTAPTTVKVKDIIPTGTSFVDGSIKIGGSSIWYTSTDLYNGIDVYLNAGQTKTLEFQVRVNDLSNNTEINNIATVDDEPTNEITHIYVKPIISSTKTQTTENGENYVVEGEKITYRITINNDGGLAKDVIVTDEIPDGTTLVYGSVKIDGIEASSSAGNISSGLTVNVQPYSTRTVTFEVTVDELPEGEVTKVIRNIAVVDGTPTNETTNTVNKADVKFSKEANPASGSTVEKGDTITYTITIDNSKGTAPATAIVKDEIPIGTTFIEGSIKIGDSTTGNTATNLSQGINVSLNAGEIKTLEFKVTVNDLNNGTIIENVATVNDTETNKTIHTYIEPVISGNKTAETENGLDYVVEGEKITYIITVMNDGGLADNVLIQDNIPTGASFVDGSIKISNNPDTANLGESDLASGITVNVPAYGEITLSFEVTVNKLADGTYGETIRNTAFIDETPTDEITEEVKKPNLEISKSSSPESGSTVTLENEITYTILLDNSKGTAPITAVVKDEVPTGTTFIEGSIKIGDLTTGNTATNLSQGIRVSLNAGERKILEFKVSVNDLENDTKIENVATVNDTETNKTDHTYVEPIISSSKTATTEKGLEYVVEGEKITYTITVKNDGNLAKKVTIKDEIPEGTSFVEGSIKVNNASTQDTEATLESGIIVNVAERGETKLSFEVIVNPLANGELVKQISNIAVVDGEDTNEVIETVNKSAVKARKEAIPASGSTVTVDKEIKYTVTLDNSEGTAPTTAIVKDEIPTGTTFVQGSIKVGGIATEDTAEDLSQGISVSLNAGEIKTIEFRVTVNDLNNGTIIENVATVNDTETNKTEHTYVEPIINAKKTSTTEKGLEYVVEGEKITYTITVTNDGDLAKAVIIKDEIPEGTSFVENSIKINNEERTETQSDLSSGITVNVLARGEATLSFDVTINKLTENTFTKEIRNVAIVDEIPTDEITEEVRKPNVEISKTSNPPSGQNVIVGDKITYTITLDNSKGTAPEIVTVKDIIPTGTTFVEGSIKVGNSTTEDTAENLASGIGVEVQAGETKTVEFQVTVNDLNNGETIRNVATVADSSGEENPTNETIHIYIEPIIDGRKASETANGLDYVVEGEVITYTITASNTGDLEKLVTITDKIPEGTTFVEGSIRVNGQERADLAQTNLESGIQVNVPGKAGAGAGTASISFQVTVDELPDGELVKQIRNTAVVDGEDTNEVTETVNKSDVTYNKTSEPATGSKVKAGEKITYTINLTNNGTAPATVKVKDTIPTGTTFEEKSIRVNNEDLGNTLEDLTTNGIDVTIPAKEGETPSTVSISFTVTVDDLNDGDQIRNVGIANENPTNETIHTYIEPEISQEKSATTEHNLDYVVEGEKITYTIIVGNDGDLEDNVVVKDEAPAGTTFVPGSIKVNGLATQDTEDNLKGGITVNVPAQGTASISFEVTVNPLEGEDLANLSKEIENTATVDDNPTNEVTETVKKADVKYSKSSIPEAGSTVTANDEITYTITLDNSTGKAPATVVVKDNIPTGTTFVPGSIKVKGSSTGNSAEELASGIEVNLNAGESTTLEFKVTVNDLNDQDTIRNVATVDDKPTEEITHTYVEPVIDATKRQITEHSLGYVVEGEKITYTITVTNNGGLDGNAIVKDETPEGTTFVDGSIKVNGSGDDNYTEGDLNSGIEVNVPAKDGATAGTASISFEVTVDQLPTDTYEKTIRNTATVNAEDTNEVTTNVNKANLKYEKISSPASGETVENGEEITYTIRLTNDGKAPDIVKVKDNIPTGTEFVEGSIKVRGEAKPELTAENLSQGIDVTVEAENTNTVEFKVKVVDNYILENGDKITNTATVNDNPTNSTEHTYIEPIIDATKEQTTENGLNYVVEGEKITYCITVTNTGDLGKDVTVRDNIPAGTTFISDSIVIVENGTQKQGTFTESNLEDGIKVNVGAQNTTTITFQVTVNELPQGIYQEEIVNGAVVDKEPTNDVRVDVYKPHITAIKEAEPAEGTRITANDPITYTITIRNDGRTDGTTTVKDTIPEGTTFVEGSIKVGGESRAELTQENLSQGINVEVPVGEETTVEFQVTVNDLDNGETIRNVATYTNEDGEETPTEEVEHTYIEPIISSIKESETENGLGYVVEGETITYTITVSNTGDLGKLVTIQDQIPESTTFVEQSVKVNGEQRTEVTQENLSQGIQEYVNAKDEITVSFDVTVNNLLEGELRKEIVNTALVDNEPTDPVTDIVNKADVKGEKTSVPPSGETVEAGEEITYTITVRNDGTAPETAIVKDTIPTGTTFVEGSIVVEGSQETYELADLTTTGIEVALNPDESKTVEFKVTVQDLDNGTKIRNVATVDDEPTKETEHTYVEPIISGNKSFETENSLDYALEGETITYTITATNTGDAEGTVKVSDQIPKGTTFVTESITVGEEARTELTQENLETGIDVTVPAKGETTLTFQVTVNNLPAETYESTIENIAVVDGKETNEVTEEIHKPNITATKESDPTSGKEVTAGNTITYTINLSNQGTAPGEAIVKDEIPEGTTFVTGSIKVGGQAQTSLTVEDLANGIRVDLEAGESKVLEFTVTVNNLDNDTQIRNVATVNNNPTNETTHTYVEPIISQGKSATTEKGLDYVGEGEKITYTITVKNDGDLSKKVQIQDTIPEGTSFVEGSIKENDSETQYTAIDLENGIEVNVPEHEEIKVSFEVTVNDLPDGTYEETIRNTALVDGTPTNETTTEVNKAHVRIGKTSEPASGETVTANDEIRYVIVLENTEGTAPITLKVTDSIPEGTTFVENSIRVNETDLQNTLEDLTTNGINVIIPAGKTSTVEFRVIVNDLNNGYIIKNKANIMNPETQETKETNEVTHEYVEAVIEVYKEMTTEKGLSYVIPGETITYTIRLRNLGDLSAKITVKDSVPQGTEFVEGSVLLNGEQSNVTREQLETGIEVEASGNAEQTISFDVTVLEGATEVKNTAVVDKTPTNETKVPVISYEKRAEIIRQTEENISEGSVTTGDKIKYTIRVNNLGEEPVTDVTIKDVIPTGTTLSKVYNYGITNDKNEITWTIGSIAVGESLDVSFEVIVNYNNADTATIRNVATVDDEDTNETETPYDKPEIKEESWVEKTGTEFIDSTEDSITYKITYNASIKDFVGEGKVTLVDYLPYEIDVENQYLDGGLYDAKTKTITWEEELGAIDTYTNGEKTVTLEKEITVKYLYGEDAETLEGTISNRVEGTLQLTQKDPENPTQDKTVLEDKKEATHETEVQIPTYIIVHHYIEGTTTKVPSKVYGEVVEDETQEGFIGQDYTTSASSNIQENYQVLSNSGNTTGTMTRTPIEVIYYYRLQPGNIVTNTITKDGTDKIINKNDKVSYTISYTGRIENYVGNAKVEIVDYLPFAIDESLSNLNGGLYNPANHTITWTEDLGRVNTYTDGPKEISLSKNIEVVFTEMNYNGTSFINRAQGKIILEETNQEQETPEASKETETEFIKDITVEKVWDDNEDIKGRRPDSVTVQLTANGNTIYNDQELEKVGLSDENNWTYTFQDLPKYTEQGQEISYSVVETETNPGDLEYYENANIEVFNTDTTATVRVTNSYKLMDTNLDSKIEKTGTELVTSSSQEVNYNIKYNATVTEYIGTGLVTITDYLPYAIDVEKSNLDGGTYDALRNTITWTENIDHINTYTDGDYQVSINKDITVVFTNLDATAKAMVNRVTGRIDLYENETTNSVETTYETKIEIPGNVIVKYVDRNTGAEIAESYELKGLAGDAYTTEQKEIYGYTFVESTNNTSGNMIEGTIEVIYYYERTDAGGVIVHYVDEEGNKLTEDVTITGKVQDPYRTEQKDIPNYDFVRVEGPTEGELIEGTIEVTYIYKKIPAKVIVQHLEKDETPDDNTDNVVLAEEEIIEGFSGDAYSTARKEIENYKPADPEPENSTGTMTREDIYVTYYYERKPSGIVTVKYVDVDTNEEILQRQELPDGSEEYTSYREQMSGLCGLEYSTEQKDIPYYNFVEDLKPSNATGIYTEEDIEVIYYYRKQTFNLSVEKLIDRITVNGVEHSLKDGLDQIDVVASKVQETDIVVTYKIVVSNPSEIAGTATAIESIPDFFRVTDGTSAEWTENGKSLNTTVELQPGETKELTVVLRWIKNSNNFGLQVNTVTLQKVENPANYEETDLSDNTAIAEVIFSVKTGGVDLSIVLGTALIVMVGVLMITIYLKERKTK